MNFLTSIHFTPSLIEERKNVADPSRQIEPERASLSLEHFFSIFQEWWKFIKLMDESEMIMKRSLVEDFPRGIVHNKFSSRLCTLFQHLFAFKLESERIATVSGM